MLTEDELVAWVREAVGPVTGPPRRISVGSSRAMYRVPLAEADDLVARVDTGGGPTAGTVYTLAREAEVYRALSGRFALIPRFHGLHPSGHAFLMALADGEHDLATLSEPERAAICDRYVEAMADLHRLDTEPLHLPSFRRPEPGRGQARVELDTWRGIVGEGPLATPLARLALRILDDSAPPDAGPPALCHGDVGPMNFMFKDGKLTAFIDWELAHISDPHDDLAWWIFRGHEWLGASGDPEAQLQLWARAAGRRVEPVRLYWHRALVMLRIYLEVRIAMASGGARAEQTRYLRLLPALDFKLAQALAVILGEDLGEPPTPARADEALGEAARRAMASDLADHILPGLSDPEAQRRARSALDYLRHLEAVEQVSDDIRREEMRDQLELARRPLDGEAALSTSGSREDQVALLRHLMRRGARRAHLWPQMAERALARPWTLDFLNAGKALETTA